MSIEFARRMQKVKPSPTLALDKRANELKAQGEPILNLTAGQPDFDTPEFIQEAGIDAIHDGFTRYTPVDGLPSLKQAICDKLKRENNVEYKPSQIVVSTGAKQALFNAMLVLLNPGDEVIIPAPYWVSYPDMALIAEAEPVFIETSIDSSYKITADQLEAAITPKTKMLILTSPSNPTGQVYSKDELIALAEVLKKHPQVVIMSDEIYEHLIWGAKHHSMVEFAPELFDRFILINGLSKGYAMTGWRMGYAAGPENILQVMKKLQSQSTSCPNAIAQKASEAALNGGLKEVSAMVEAFEKRHDLVVARLERLENVRFIPSKGSFYIFINVEKSMAAKGFATDTELADDLLSTAKIATVPGSAFGAPGHLRLSFAMDEDTLNEAFDRFEEYGL